MSKRKLDKSVACIFMEVWIKCFDLEHLGFLYIYDTDTIKLIIDRLCDGAEDLLKNKDEFWQKAYEYAYKDLSQEICDYVLATGRNIDVSVDIQKIPQSNYTEEYKERITKLLAELHTKNTLIRLIYTWMNCVPESEAFSFNQHLLDAIIECGYENYVPAIIKEMWESGYDDYVWMKCIYTENLKPKILFDIEQSGIPLDEIVLRYYLMMSSDEVKTLNIIKYVQPPFNWSKVVKDIYTIDKDGEVHNYGEVFLDCKETRAAISKRYKEMRCKS